MFVDQCKESGDACLVVYLFGSSRTAGAQQVCHRPISDESNNELSNPCEVSVMWTNPGCADHERSARGASILLRYFDGGTPPREDHIKAENQGINRNRFMCSIKQELLLTVVQIEAPRWGDQQQNSLIDHTFGQSSGDTNTRLDGFDKSRCAISSGLDRLYEHDPSRFG